MEAVQRPSQQLIPPPLGGTPKLTIDRFSDGTIACLKFTGTIDEAFEGRKLAGSIKASTLVLDLGGVKKISSFGIREWVDFILAAGKQVAAIVLVECSPKVIDQLNMVANFAGGGRVFSFYAPFRCDYCDSEHRVLLQIDRDHETIKSMKLAERPCNSCSESMYFDEDGATYFSYLIGQERFELAADVAAFLAAKLDYAVSDAARKLRIDKAIEGRVTYLRLSGDLDRTFPKDKLAEGLEGTVIIDVTSLGRIEPAGAAEWRAFVTMVAPLVDQLYVLGAAPPFLEKLASREDLGPKAQILSAVLPYACTTCSTSSGQTIDIDTHFDVLKFATAPELRCTQCKNPMQCTASETVMTILPTLPQPVPPDGLRATVALLRERSLSSAAAKRPTTTSQAQAPLSVARTPLWVPLTAALIAVGVAGGGFLAYRATVGKKAVVAGLGTIIARSADVKPTWVGTLAPGATTCTDAADHGVTCIAASAAALTSDDGADEAGDAAVDSLAAAIAAHIKDPAWRGAVPPIYQASRDAKLAAFDRDPTSSVARRDVRDARHAVAALARATGGGAIPAIPTARYWEQYESADGKRWVAYAQLVVPGAQLAQLVTSYGASASALGVSAVGLFPLIGWRYPKVDHGAIVASLTDGPLQRVGLADQYVVLAIDGHDITDAASFAKIATAEHATLEDRGGTLLLKIQAGDGGPREFSAQIAGPPVEPVIDHPHVGGGSQGGGDSHVNLTPGSVNVWDRYSTTKPGDRNDPNQ